MRFKFGDTIKCNCGCGEQGTVDYVDDDENSYAILNRWLNLVTVMERNATLIKKAIVSRQQKTYLACEPINKPNIEGNK